MKIGEVAKAAGVTTSRIRFYEKQGIIPPAERNDNGYRDYPSDLIGTLKFIEQAQHLGFSLREIGQIDVKSGEHPISCDLAIELLIKKLTGVEELIVDARRRKAAIEAMIAELQKTKSA